MNISSILKQQGIHSPVLVLELEDAIRRHQIQVPSHRVPNPIDAEELEWIEPMNLSLQKLAA